MPCKPCTQAPPPHGNQALLEEEDDDLVMTPLLRAIASRDEAEYLTAT